MSSFSLYPKTVKIQDSNILHKNYGTQTHETTPIPPPRPSLDQTSKRPPTLIVGESLPLGGWTYTFARSCWTCLSYIPSCSSFYFPVLFKPYTTRSNLCHDLSTFSKSPHLVPFSPVRYRARLSCGNVPEEERNDTLSKLTVSLTLSNRKSLVPGGTHI